MDLSIIQIKSRTVVIGMSVLAAVSIFAVYRSARDRKELEQLREQTVVLHERIGKLNSSYESIRSYTRDVGSFADSAYGNDIIKSPESFEVLGVNQPAPSFTGFNSLNKWVVSENALEMSRTDSENFALAVASVDSATKGTDLIVGRLRSLATILKYNGDILKSVPSLKPVDGPITSDFGMRLSPFEGKKTFHTGVDIAAVQGAKVRAPAVGKVTYVGEFETLGLTVVLDHGAGTLTRFGHLKKALVKKGQLVNRGDEIAAVGMTGHTTGPHLHYEIWLRNVAVNPRDFFFDISDTPVAVANKNRKKSPQTAYLKGIGGDE